MTSTLTAHATEALKAAYQARVGELKTAAAGGLQDCYDATVDRLGFDPLVESRS